jgi:hypothetical protein
VYLKVFTGIVPLKTNDQLPILHKKKEYEYPAEEDDEW